MLSHRKTLAQIQEREKWPPRLLKNIHYKAKSSLMIFLILKYSLLFEKFLWRKVASCNFTK